MTNNEFIMRSTNCAKLSKIRTMRSTDKYWMQSMCYIPSENALVICHRKLETETSSIEKINYATMNRINIKNNLNYGHVNDITYNSKTNKLYLTPMFDGKSGKDRNVIYELNASTFEKEREIHVGATTTMSIDAIAYDSERNQYYVAIDKYIVTLNSDFEIGTRFEFDFQKGFTFQNIEYYDGKIFASYIGKIDVFDVTGNYLKYIATGEGIEAEGIASIGEGKFVLGKVYNTYIGIIVNELFLFNLFDCKIINELLPTDVWVKVKGQVKINNNFNYIRKIGNLVQCSVCFTNITSASSTPIAEIPEGYRPMNYLRVIGACGGNNFARFEISKAGDIIMNATSLSSIQSNHWFELEVTYLVN